jgi:hypothetical protein
MFKKRETVEALRFSGPRRRSAELPDADVMTRVGRATLTEAWAERHTGRSLRESWRRVGRVGKVC